MTAKEASRAQRAAGTVQLNVRIRQELADRLRQRAEELHSNTGTLVAQAIEQLLAKDGQTPQRDHEQRLLSLERRLQDLEALLHRRTETPNSQ
jgi:polyhydroxyalkanoate synthesis regulator phasin